MNYLKLLFGVCFLIVMATLFSNNRVISSEPKLKSYYLTVKCTSYCPCELCCGSSTDGKTATGRDANKKGVAVDKSVIPLGSRLDIPNYGNWVLADDVGGKIVGKHIDIRFKTHQKALDWGVRKVTIRIWKKK